MATGLPTSLTTAIFLAAALLTAPAAGAAASTEEQRAAWATSQPRVFSHGREANPEAVCFGYGFYEADGGGTAVIDGQPCSKIRAPIPVHRGGWVLVHTRRAARAVAIAAPPSRDPPPPPQPCRRDEPGRWTCRVPPPAGAGYLELSIAYRGAGSVWSFQVAPHSPDRHG